MAEISAQEVMKLRNRTGLSMMECKKALQETEGDLAKAEELLRKKMKGKMDARTDRGAGEGRIAVALSTSPPAAAIIEIRAETDFTARNEKFVHVCNTVAKLALTGQSGEVQASPAITAAVDEIRITTGENCSYARGYKMVGAESTAKFGSYVHHDGKTGVIVHADGPASDELLRQLCMHITAAVPRPLGITQQDIPVDVVEKERRIALEEAMESGKPAQIAEKMVEGKLRKFFEDVALLEQPFVMDPEKKIKDLVGQGVKIVAFRRWAVGESAGETSPTL